MGYYTYFTLNVLNWKELNRQEQQRITGELRDMDVFEDIGDGYAYADAKWYDSDEDMYILSKRCPKALFSLEGDGEEDGDLWQVFYKNGMAQNANVRIERDEFDPKLLRPHECAEKFSANEIQNRKYTYQR